MGLFCMILGGVIFVGFSFGGYLFASAFTTAGFTNVLAGTATISLGELLKLPSSDSLGTFLVIFGVCFFIGLISGIGVFMNGLIYRKVCRIKRRRPVER